MDAVPNFNLDDFEDGFGEEDDALLAKALDESSTAWNEGEPQPVPSGTPLEMLPGFDLSSGHTWIYPSNMSHRGYQFDIVKSCLFKNTLVCLPTGLGKTFIAAVVMYNFYRWYPQGKIVFMAPTKPLVAQQIEACFRIMGIPQADTREMTGSVSVKERAKAWTSQRVFFLTPQVMSNDLSRGLFPAKEVKLLVVDEAHKAQGEFAYCLVARELARAGAVTRIVALSATPGTDIPSVKAVLQNLFISHIELRHDESPDILPFTHARIIEKKVVEMAGEMLEVREKLLGVMEIYTKRLSATGAIRKGTNPSVYSKFSFIDSRSEWRQNPPANILSHVRGQVEADFATSIKLYHGMVLLTTQGLRSFHNFFTKEDPEDKSSKRILGELRRIPLWRDILAFLAERFIGDAGNSRLNQSRPMLSQQGGESAAPAVNQKTATSHPKMDSLLEVVFEHFAKFKREGQETRVIIFSQFRDCVTELVACLSNHKPVIRPMPFIGQAGAGTKKGFTQKEQLEVVRRFKTGGYNTLVSTCVGEEGLDIGEVDLIVLYDVASSPIRLVQRMGRTGRKREGRIVVLLTKGDEERKYNQTVARKKSLNTAILDQQKLEHALFPNAPRMVPLGLEPQCHKMKMIIGDWKSKHDGASRSSDGGLRTLNGFVKKVGKNDLLNINCGFLTEDDEERWNREVRYDGEIKKIPNAQEVWFKGCQDVPEKMFDTEQFNLSEWSLWQTGPQYRKFVGPSSLSATYNRILALTRNRDLHGQTEKVSVGVTDEKDEDKMPTIESEKVNGSVKIQKVVDDSNQSRSKSRNSIMNYFKPTQESLPSTSFNKDLPITEHEMLEIIDEEDHVIAPPTEPEILEIIDQEDDAIAPPSTPEISKEGSNKMPNEDSVLIEELLDDSGFESEHQSPVQTWWNIRKLIDNPPTSEEVEKFDVMAHIKKVKAKLQHTTSQKVLGNVCTSEMTLGFEDTVKQQLIVMPLEKDDSIDDMFADDSFFNEIDNSTNDKELIPKSNVKEGKTNDVLLGEPAIENYEAELSCFDLGSPILEEAVSTSSTPLAGHWLKSRPAVPELTPVVPIRRTNIQASPQFCKPSSPTAVAAAKPSRADTLEENFNDDPFEDDDMFADLMKDNCETLASGVSKSLFSATQLVSLVNKSGNNTASETPKPKISRIKLSKLFDEVEGSQEQSLANVNLIEPSKSNSDQMVDSIEGEALEFPEIETKPAQVSLEVNNHLSDDEGPLSDESVNLLLLDPPAEPDSPAGPSPEPTLTATLPASLPADHSPPPPEPTPPVPAPSKQVCPVCNQVVVGEINSHIDLCLNRDLVCQLSQTGGTPSPPIAMPADRLSSPEGSDAGSPVARGMKRARGIDSSPPRLGLSSPDSPVVGGRKRVRVIDSPARSRLASPGSSDADSPVARGLKRARVVDSPARSRLASPGSSDGDSPVARGLKRARVMDSPLSQMNRSQRAEISSSSDDLTVVREKVLKANHLKKPDNEFIIAEAEVSGSEASGDEEDMADNYDESFVDDATQHGSRAMYLQSIKSPQFKIPARKLAPITDDIYSQVPQDDSEDSYMEDSFVVGSQVEYESQHDTLEILERGAVRSSGSKRRTTPSISSSRKRRRIIAPDPDESSIAEHSIQKEDQSNFEIDFDDSFNVSGSFFEGEGTMKKQVDLSSFSGNEKVVPMNDNGSKTDLRNGSRSVEAEFDMDFDDSFPESQSLLNVIPDDSKAKEHLLLKPDLSTSILESEKIPVIVSTSEVNKISEVISLLKHEHGMSVCVRRSDVAGFILGQELAVQRVSEAEFGLGSLRERLEEKMSGMQQEYERVVLVLEWEQSKPGERTKVGTRTQHFDLTVAQLSLSGVTVLNSSSKADTARLLHELALQEQGAGRGLPRPLKPTVWQEQMVSWLTEFPGLGLGNAIHLAHHFSTLHEIITSSLDTLSNTLSRGRATQLVSIFNKTFNPEMISMAPL